MADNGVLQAMHDALNVEISKAEEAFAQVVAPLQAKRDHLAKLIAWKPGEPLPAEVPAVTSPAPPPPPNGAPIGGTSAEEAAKWAAEIKAAHGRKWVRTEALKKEFPHVQFPVLFGRKLVEAQGSGRGREYRVK